MEKPTIESWDHLGFGHVQSSLQRRMVFSVRLELDSFIEVLDANRHPIERATVRPVVERLH
jgi:hypothetical protein